MTAFCGGAEAATCRPVDASNSDVGHLPEDG